MRRRLDRVMPLRGAPCVLYFIGVDLLLVIAPHLPVSAGLSVVGSAALAGGLWCGLNFWRCRQAHCAIPGVGWVGLAILAFVGAAIGRSIIGGYEQLAFLAVLLLAAIFERSWYLARGTRFIRRPERSLPISPG